MSSHPGLCHLSLLLITFQVEDLKSQLVTQDDSHRLVRQEIQEKVKEAQECSRIQKELEKEKARYAGKPEGWLAFHAVVTVALALLHKVTSHVSLWLHLEPSRVDMVSALNLTLVLFHTCLEKTFYAPLSCDNVNPAPVEVMFCGEIFNRTIF